MSDPSALPIQHASSRIRSDKTMALFSVRLQGMSLAILPYSLQDDEDVVLAAIRQNSNAIEYASVRLQEKYRTQ